MLKRFVFDREDQPGEAWLGRFAAGRAEAESWYRGQGLAPPPSAEDCRVALREHMPELVPHYDRACALVGNDDVAHRMLSHYRPPPAIFGCSQTVWLGVAGPALVRNYDYPLDIVSDRFEITEWSGRKVIAKAQRPWGGCLDGMNEDGFVASVTYGGSRAQGLGFSVILIIRYVLETCRRVDEGIQAFCRIPIALSQNVTLLDRSGDHATLFLGPGQEPVISRLPACTNHQDCPNAMESPAVADSVMRQQTLLNALYDPTMNLATLTELFLKPPIYSQQIRSPTVYTAIYRPAEGRVDYLWPGKRWVQRFDGFVSGEYTHDYGELTP
jgi:predicted choloylglycine hydrolase